VLWAVVRHEWERGARGLHDNERHHTAAATVNHIATFRWQRLDHAPYSPDLAPSDFHFFLVLKRTLEGRRFNTNEDAEAAVRTQDIDFYEQEFFKLVKLWDNSINVGGD
jgi:histone-lysine N-methyltransferase SETMAR